MRIQDRCFCIIAAALVFLAAACGASKTILPSLTFQDEAIREELELAAIMESAGRQLEEQMEALASRGLIGHDCRLGRALPVLSLADSLSGDTSPISFSGGWVALIETPGEEACQCVYAGELLTADPYVQQGFGGDFLRFAQECRWAEEAGNIPCAYLDIGTTEFLPLLLTETPEGSFLLLWYDDPIAVLSTRGDVREDYFWAETNVTSGTAHYFVDLDVLAEGYTRYLAATAAYPRNYLGFKWLPLDS